jgi:hypothetical protein
MICYTVVTTRITITILDWTVLCTSRQYTGLDCGCHSIGLYWIERAMILPVDTGRYITTSLRVIILYHRIVVTLWLSSANQKQWTTSEAVFRKVSRNLAVLSFYNRNPKNWPTCGGRFRRRIRCFYCCCQCYHFILHVLQSLKIHHLFQCSLKTFCSYHLRRIWWWITHFSWHFWVL